MSSYSIVASTLKGGIGAKGALPWKLPSDMIHFEHVTKTLNKQEVSQKRRKVEGSGPSGPSGSSEETMNGLIMGRKTLMSLPVRLRPLPERDSCVITRDALKFKEEVKVSARPLETAGSLKEGITKMQSKGCPSVFVAGGSALYNEAHEHRLVDRVLWTRVTGVDNEKLDTHINTKSLLKNYTPVTVTQTRTHENLTYDLLVLEKKKERTDESQLREPMNQEVPAELKNGPFDSVTGKNHRSAGSSEPFYEIKGETIKKNFPLLRKVENKEFQYLDIMDDIIHNGLESDDRTGIGTFYKFGKVMRYDLEDSFPLLTTKRVYWKGVVEELLWFLRGKTDAKILSDNNVHIWDGNGSREFLDSRGLFHRREGDLGPVYGFQWRHFGADYLTCDDDYENKGFDQIKALIHQIKTNPTSRRLILSAWNPAALEKMALPPCHILCQFQVDVEKKHLSAIMFQRSADWGLGVPFNIASYSLLVHIIAQLTGLTAKEFVHVVGNAHVYKNHVEPLKTQLTRLPRPFPQLKINKDVQQVEDFKLEDFELIGYEPWSTIKMEMAV